MRCGLGSGRVGRWGRSVGIGGRVVVPGRAHRTGGRRGAGTRLKLGPLTTCLLLLASSVASAAPLNLVDSTGALHSFTPPSLNDAGFAAFRASMVTGGTGIFAANGLGYYDVADSLGPYSSFLSQVEINDGSVVLFGAFLDVGGGASGIYVGPDPIADRIVDKSPPYLGLGLYAISDSGTAVFWASRDTGEFGIYEGNGSVVVDDTGPFASFGTWPAINVLDQVAFRATTDAGDLGIFVGPQVTADRLVDTTGPFAGFGEPLSINDLGTVVFQGTLDTGVTGIFLGPDPLTDTIADSSGPFAGFSNPAVNDQGHVVFTATLDAGGSGLFSGPDPVLDRVIATGDPLFGSTVLAVGFFPGGLNDLGQVAFYYYLADGREGIALTTVPEPSMSVALAASIVVLAATIGRRGRRSV
ncbi:MAG: hypothetical protein H6748_04055 [Spirochaetaceae bacterium]|nr:hypothetical protein [Myxococcales bacterium]MCB9723206.1 hypothetical protein [Spirochaetaceae bacterium]HPG24611.1 hypothetical protein [Myxococcota bacterium]